MMRSFIPNQKREIDERISKSQEEEKKKMIKSALGHDGT
jgi:hypothetical protein